MLVTRPVLAGASIGTVVRRPAAAIAAGLASHLIMDACLHQWPQNEVGHRQPHEVASAGVLAVAAGPGAATPEAPSLPWTLNAVRR
jgi:hypothetical protein